MYRIEPLQNCLDSSVSFKQNKLPSYTNLDSDLISSDTGLVINHPLVIVEFVNQTLPQADPDYYKEWDNVTIFSIDDLVKITSGAKIRFYKSLIDGNAGNDPAVVVSPSLWEEFDPVSDYLREIRKESINEVIEDVMTHKKIHQEIKEVFEKVTIHRGSGRLTDKEIKKDRFVGYELTILGQDQLTSIINRIGLQFDGAESFDLLLFHSSRLKPIATIPINITNSFVFDWVIPDETILKYTSEEYETGGLFYIGYKESDITGQAIIKKDVDFVKGPCGSCNRIYRQEWEKYSKYLRVRTISVPETEMSLAGLGLWDIEKTEYVTNTNWGLNLEISMSCDLTDYLCRNKRMLSTPIKLKTEINVIEMMKNNSRIGVIPDKARIRAVNALQDGDNKNMLPHQYWRSIKALNFDLTELGSVCFPCSGPRKIRRKVV